MKAFRVLILTLAAAMFTASLAAAGTATPRIDRREARQHVRIHQGVHSGQLTRGEARSLRAGQRHIHRMECRAKANGKVTARERMRINRAQNRQSRHIWRMKHNGANRRGR